MPSDGTSLLAALEAIAACERLAAQLPQLADWLGHAASVARPDWSGPHRDTFDDRAALTDRALRQAAASVQLLRVRIEDAASAPR